MNFQGELGTKKYGGLEYTGNTLRRRILFDLILFNHPNIKFSKINQLQTTDGRKRTLATAQRNEMQ